MAPERSRRHVLAAVGGAGLSALAGCTTTGGTDDLCGDPDEYTPPDATVRGDGDGDFPVPSADAAWTHARADAAATGYVSVDGPLSRATYQWSVELPTEYGTPVAPVVADGRLFLAALEAGVLRAYDGSGRRWTADGHDYVTRPAVEDGTVYVGDGEGMYAYDPTDGSRDWTFPVPGDGGVNRVVATDRGAFVHAGEFVFALTADGSERWRAPATELGAVADGTVYVDDGRTVAIDAETGARQWASQPTNTYGEMAVRDGTLYATAHNTLYALDGADGSLRWSYSGEEEYFDQPTVTPDRVYVPSSPIEGRDGGNLYALDRETGEPAWCSHLGFVDVVAPAATDAGVVVATDEGLVRAFDHDGNATWTFDQASAWFTEVVVAGNVVFAGSGQARIFGLVGA